MRKLVREYVCVSVCVCVCVYVCVYVSGVEKSTHVVLFLSRSLSASSVTSCRVVFKLKIIIFRKLGTQHIQKF